LNNALSAAKFILLKIVVGRNSSLLGKTILYYKKDKNTILSEF
jgi:hypothetical protein